MTELSNGRMRSTAPQLARFVAAFVGVILGILAAYDHDVLGVFVWTLFVALFALVLPMSAGRPTSRGWRVTAWLLVALLIIAALWRVVDHLRALAAR